MNNRKEENMIEEYKGKWFNPYSFWCDIKMYYCSEEKNCYNCEIKCPTCNRPMKEE